MSGCGQRFRHDPFHPEPQAYPLCHCYSVFDAGVGNLVSPAEGVAGGRHPAGVLPAGAEGSEGYAGRRRGPTILVVSPAEGVAGGRHPARVAPAGADGCEGFAGRRRGLARVITAPAEGVAGGRHPARVAPAGADGCEGFPGRRRGLAIYVVTPQVWLPPALTDAKER